MSKPIFTWTIDQIPPGGQAYTADGWVRRCWGADCDVTWNNGSDPWPMFILDHAEHGATHDGVQIPGYNVAILPR